MKCALVIISLLISHLLSAQNLIYNGGFEDVNICKELNSFCGAEAWFRSPPRKSGRNIARAKGYKKVRTGNGSENIVVENVRRPIESRVFIYSMLKCALIQGEKYVVSLWLNPTKNTVIELDVLLSEKELVPGVINPLDLSPSFSYKSKDIKESDGQWINYVYEYIAKGEERFITIGNFDKDRYCPDRKLKEDNKAGDIMYFVDDISLYPIDEKLLQHCDSLGIRKMLYAFNHRHSYRIGLSFANEPQVTKAQKTPPVKTIEIPDIAFNFDSFNINPEYSAVIDSIYEYIQSLDPQSLEIVGHTDNLGSNEYNQKLSFERAEEVKKTLLKKSKILENIITTKGVGESLPKADNNTEENRQLNRRVEVKVILKSSH